MITRYKLDPRILILSFVLIIFSGSFDGANASTSHLSPIYKSLYNRNYPEIINQAERLKARYPNDNTLYYLQGYAYLKTNNEALALQCFSKAISLNRNKGDVYLFRAMMYQRSGRFKEALDDLNRAIKDKNTPVQLGELDKLRGYYPSPEFHHPRMYFFRAVTNKSLGRYKEAMSDINQVFDLSPKPFPLHFSTRGDINFLTHNFALAYDDYQKAVNIDPKMAGAWSSMGHCALYLGNYTGAITHFKKALELYPENPGALRDLGLAYLLNGEYDKALESMGQGVRKNPDEMSYYNLAFLHHLNGNQGLALKFFKKSQELYPTILGLGSIFVDNTPVSSPTRKFFQDQLTTAKMYLGAGKTSTDTASENQKPSLKITKLILQPDPVKMNTPFDIVINFNVDIPGGKKQIPVLFYFTISQNGKILFKSNTDTINADNSKISTWTHHMNPVPAKGIFTVTADIKYKELLAKQSIKLIIK